MLSLSGRLGMDEEFEASSGVIGIFLDSSMRLEYVMSNGDYSCNVGGSYCRGVSVGSGL